MSYRIDETHDRAVTAILRWCEWYTRSLPPDIVQDRLDELASDLHEHEADLRAAGIDAVTARRLIVGRAVRGAPADLLWRETQLRRVEALRLGLATTREATVTHRLTVAITIVGASAVVVSAVAWVRSAVLGSPGPGAATPLWFALTTLVLALGVSSFARPTTRLLGALLIALALPALTLELAGHPLAALLVAPLSVACLAVGLLLHRLRRR